MRDYFDFDTTPCDENCAQVGRDDYRRIAWHEYEAMRGQLERTFGEYPVGVSSTHKACLHDFGTYYQFRLYYDMNDQTCVDYAYRIEAEWPENWDDIAREYLQSNNALAGRIA